MEQARMDRAMKRIEDALARIEAAARRRGDGDDGRGNNALRSRVTSALGELDALIGKLER